MSCKVPSPITTLRGHNAGVTALAYCKHRDEPYLLSGDEDGSLIIWNLTIFRKYRQYTNLVRSRIQSVKVIQLSIDSEKHDILVVQSRNNGLHLTNLTKSFTDECGTPAQILAEFPTYDSLFSRGDSLSIKAGSLAILAYPSYIESNLATVRIVNANVQTKISGTAQRESDEPKKSCPVFDMVIKENPTGGYLLFIAYEDGCLCVFSFCLETTKTVPLLNSEGLKIDHIKTYDVKIGDFISAFDVMLNNQESISLICGSPAKSLMIINDSIKFSSHEPSVNNIDLKRQGTSAIAIRPDSKLFVASGWDNSINLYSIKSRKHLVNLNYHLKQVQSILFFEKPNFLETNNSKETEYLLCCASMDGTISITSIY